MKEISSIGVLIDSDIEEVKEALEPRTYGELTNIKKMIELEYNKVTSMVEDIKSQLEKGKYKSSNILKAECTLQQLYVALARIENVATVIEALKKDKEPFLYKQERERKALLKQPSNLLN